ncbi:T9SS type A sorting domain-containing protein [Candidatus Poribacteria bacterium]|nr:T9SS type A sorting domain-containing protein [Candidatus Poribacteria bacterium]
MKNTVVSISLTLILISTLYLFPAYPQGVSEVPLTLSGHDNAIKSLSFSPNGQTLASGSFDKTARLWDASTGNTLRTLQGHTDAVLSVAFSPDGQTIASGSWDNTIRLWDASTGNTLRTLQGHTDDVESVVFSPDGQTIVSGSKDNTIRLWDPNTGNTLRTFSGHGGDVVSVAFSPDGQMIASGSHDKTIRLWDSNTGNTLRTFSGHTGWIWSIVFSPDGQTIASGSHDKTVHLWEMATGDHLQTLSEHTGFVMSIAFSRDGRTLASGSADNTIKLWEFAPSVVSNGAVVPNTTVASNTTVTISPASVQSPAIGKQLTLHLKIRDSKTVAGYQASVQFDTTALSYVSGTNGDYLPAGAFFVEPKVEGNLVKLSAASLAGESNGDGTLATLTFEVIAVKASNVTLSDVLLTNSAGETFVPRIENGEITESTRLKEDVNGDGTVNIADLVLVAGALGETGQNAADVNDDGIVNIADLVLVAGALGTSAAAPALHPHTLEMLTAAEIKQWLSAAQQLSITDTTSQRGILFLQQLLTALTPKETVLLANYPNPFNPETWIPYHLAKDADVTLHIYAINGTLVRALVLGHQPAGMYQNRSRAAYWDGKNAFGEKVASGVYFFTLTAGDFTATRKMLIRK